MFPLGMAMAAAKETGTACQQGIQYNLVALPGHKIRAGMKLDLCRDWHRFRLPCSRSGSMS